MRYSNTTIRELSAKYRSILKKCACLNAIILLSVAFAMSADAASISWEGLTDLQMNEGDIWTTRETRTVSGVLT